MKHNRDKLTILEAVAILAHYRYSRALGKITAAKRPEDIAEVRRVQAQVYLKRGNVDSHQIASNGGLDYKTDPYQPISTYYSLVSRGEVKAAGRLLASNDWADLQAAKEIELGAMFTKDEMLVELSGVVRTEKSSKLSASSLTLAILKAAFESGADAVIAVVSDGPHRRFMKMGGPYIVELGDSFRIPHGKNHVYPMALLRHPAGRPSFAQRLVMREVLG